MLDPLRFPARRGHAAVVMRFQFADAGGVIGVVVRHQNIGEPPPRLFERRLDRGGLRSVNCGGGAALRIVKQNAEIVLQAPEQICLRRHGSLTWADGITSGNDKSRCNKVKYPARPTARARPAPTCYFAAMDVVDLR